MMTVMIWIATALAIAGAVYSVERLVAWRKQGGLAGGEKPLENLVDPRLVASEERDEFIEILGDLLPDHDSDPVEAVTRQVNTGIIHVLATFKNTIVTVTDEKGAVLGWSSAGKLGIKGSRKSKAFTAKLVSQDACRQAKAYGVKEVSLRVKGHGPGRNAAVQAVSDLGFGVLVVEEVGGSPDMPSAGQTVG